MSATNAAASYDSFDDRYLGAKASDPSVDNDGDALIAGATYFNTTSDSMKVYSGSAWSDVAPVATSVTLSQVTDFPTQSGQSGKYLTTNGTVPSWATLTTDPTLGTLTKTFTSGESASISLTSSVLAPVVSVTKEVPQTGVTNNSWDVSSTTENYTRLDSAAATTLDWVANDDVSAATETSITLSGATQSTDLLGGTIGNTGQNAYMLDQTDGTIYQYSLSVAYDLSSGSYESKTFNVLSQQSDPRNIFFKTDGTVLYVIGTTNQAIYQYSLSTAWDISTASYDSKTFSASSQSNGTSGLFIKPDGSKLYIVAYSNDAVYQYSLSTAWDISTASYDSVSLSVSSQDSTPRDITFNDDGTVLYMCGTGNNALYQYELTTAYDLSSASYSSNALSLSTTVFSISYSSASLQLVIFQSLTDILKTIRLSNTLTLGTGSFASADVGKTIEANSGEFVLTATDGSYVETTAPTSYDQVASGDWSMYGVVYNAADGDLELSSYIQGYSLSSGSKDGSNEFTGTGTIECSFLGNNGTKLYQQDMSNRLVREYNLSTAYDLTTATSTGNTISSQSYGGISENSPRAVFVSPDGVHLYTIGSSNGRAGRYDMSTPWDLSTASYVQLFDFGAWGSTYGLVFSPDGLNVFTLENTSSTEIQGFSLSTAWDITTASNDGSPFNVDSNIASGSWEGLSVSADGTRLFPSLGTTVYEVRLSTAWNISTASYTAGNNLVTPYTVRGSQPVKDGLQFALQNGNKVELWNTGLANIPTGYQPVHTTSSIDTEYWTDINSMTADQNAGDGEVYYAISTDDRTTWTVIDNTDGERDIVRNNAGTWQYNSNGTYASETWVNGATNTELATLAEAMEGATSPFDVSSAVYSQTFSVTPQEIFPKGLAFNTDGTKMFVSGSSGDDVNEYALSTGFDVSTASFTDSFSLASQDTNPAGLAFNTDGTKMFSVGSVGVDVNEYALSTGFDVSTASFTDAFDLSGQDTNPRGLAFSTDGTKMFVVGGGGVDVNEYTLSTGFDVSTSTFVDSFDVSAQETAPHGIAFNTDGTKMFVTGTVSENVNEYTLSTGFDVSTASFVDSFNVSSQDVSPVAISFNANGSKMFVLGLEDDTVNEYSTTSYVNQMDKTQLDAVTDPNHIALGDDLDLAIVFNMTSGSTVPSSDGVAINYDANVLNKGAVLGTDYDFDAPAQNSVRITALAGNNLKVRVV